MAIIAKHPAVATTINVFQVAPEHQQEALDLLTTMARHLIQTVPGLLSANILISTDGQRIVNYAQYTDEAAIAEVEAGVRSLVLSSTSQQLRLLAKSDFHTYTVAAIVEASGDQEAPKETEDEEVGR